MHDLLIVTPSRGRPGRLAQMITACLDLSQSRTDIAVAVDDDQAGLYAGVARSHRHGGRVLFCQGPRQGLTGWTNQVARLHGHRYRALASLGDDHLPRTEGWDKLLLDAITGTGGTGIAYGNDLIFGGDLPTAPVISTSIVRALGWMCEPSLRHMCTDLVWKDLGMQAGCLAYVPEVTIEHVHWCNGKAAPDQTYAEAEAGHQEDRDAYARWRGERMARDVDTVKALLGHAA